MAIEHTVEAETTDSKNVYPFWEKFVAKTGALVHDVKELIEKKGVSVGDVLTVLSPIISPSFILAGMTTRSDEMFFLGLLVGGLGVVGFQNFSDEIEKLRKDRKTTEQQSKIQWVKPPEKVLEDLQASESSKGL